MAVAIYDQDEDENINGMIIHHKKGELKLDANGDPYAEILGDREYYGRDVISWQDTLLKEGSRLNDFNPFDSDGIRQGAAATITKTALRLLPYFIPYVRYVWGAIDIARETATALPAMAKAFDGIITNNSSNDELGNKLTRWENYMQSLKPGMSQYGKQNFFSLESIGNIIADSGGQLMSQTMVAKIPNMLVKNPTLRTTRLGQNMALGYMALTSSTESYSQFKQAGASDRVAGLGAVAVAAGMYALMNTNYFRQLFWEGTPLDENRIVELASTKAMEAIATESFPGVSASAGKTGLMKSLNAWAESSNDNSFNLMKAVYKKVSNWVASVDKDPVTFESLKNVVTKEGFTQVASTYALRALNEGYEEVVEEIIQDLVKASSLLAEKAGATVTADYDDKLDFGLS